MDNKRTLFREFDQMLFSFVKFYGGQHKMRGKWIQPTFPKSILLLSFPLKCIPHTKGQKHRALLNQQQWNVANISSKVLCLTQLCVYFINNGIRETNRISNAFMFDYYYRLTIIDSPLFPLIRRNNNIRIYSITSIHQLIIMNNKINHMRPHSACNQIRRKLFPLFN